MNAVRAPVEYLAHALSTGKSTPSKCKTRSPSRNIKIPLYIAAGIPAWIVNIPERKVEFYGSQRRDYREGETFEVLGVSIPVWDLF